MPSKQTNNLGIIVLFLNWVVNWLFAVCVDRFTLLEASDTLVFGFLMSGVVDAAVIED